MGKEEGILMIIKEKRSIIPACDVETLEELGRLVKATCMIQGVSAYKIGFELVIPFGMKKVVEIIRRHTDKPIIYDHQKAGTDVPFTGERFAKVCKASGVDAVILFPQAGPETLRAWIAACQAQGLQVIVGGEMTHKGFLQSDGGFISDDAPSRIYALAAEQGITDFVVPGNKPEQITTYRQLLEAKGVKPAFYSPGLISQGGDLTEGAKAAGDSWHAIIGRALYQADDMAAKAKELVAALVMS